mmetsp:Transcript_11689/g.17154  ORF Transcript_11689/g.17154 Transcript_11689/m.17154 type:complete len:167 (-) Transcript_11689:67-567(-)|eukprot:CAMPEP_0194211136 /NCGR_PEP_ID=MMETSP0156-20130528/9596_1 /TAXON_ID=33649 /ORGANISM="Thalassionema nitzschioides, Strain L26-B" /LENGTH=166 /DNA_ID=CAMNT_0038938593 /DNA_START=119 /DNA_END=619 /DNA_ORIENTATION=+
MKLIKKEPRLLHDCDDDSQSSEIIVIRSTKPKKRITFCENVTVSDTIHVDNISDKEKELAWYSQKEMLMIRMQANYDMKRLEAGKTDKRKICIRGLESRTTSERMETRRKNIYDSITAVLDEQDQQYENDSYDEERIRKLYQVISKTCELEAQNVGASDAVAARLI